VLGDSWVNYGCQGRPLGARCFGFVLFCDTDPVGVQGPKRVNPSVGRWLGHAVVAVSCVQVNPDKDRCLSLCVGNRVLVVELLGV
jgi:hypothetical protein